MEAIQEYRSSTQYSMKSPNTNTLSPAINKEKKKKTTQTAKGPTNLKKMLIDQNAALNK